MGLFFCNSRTIRVKKPLALKNRKHFRRNALFERIRPCEVRTFLTLFNEQNQMLEDFKQEINVISKITAIGSNSRLKPSAY
jgi:hypothetical protein